MTIKELMEERFAQMTVSERKIYRKILENSTLFSLKPIAEVASELNLSSATLVRFAQSLGFSGYADFRHSLQKEEILSSSPASRMKSLIESHYSTSTEQMLQAEQNLLSEFVKSLDQPMLTQFVDELLETSKCFVFGWRESSFLAEIFAYRLRYTRMEAVAISRAQNELAESLIHAPSKSIAIVFDYFPYSKAVLNAATYLDGKSVNIALVTDFRSSKICDFAKYVFFCPSRSEYLLNSLINPIFFINAVVTELLQRESETFVDYLAEREKVFDQSGEFYL